MTNCLRLIGGLNILTGFYTSPVCDYVIPGLTHEEMVAQGMLFLVAGYETTKSALSFLGYLLAVTDECQDKLIAEIDEVMKGEVITSFGIMVLNERRLRKFNK